MLQVGYHKIAQRKESYHASEGLPADSAGVVHSCQADIGAVGDARMRWLCPDSALPNQLLAGPALEAAGMPPAGMRHIDTPPSIVGSKDIGKMHTLFLIDPADVTAWSAVHRILATRGRMDTCTYLLPLKSI